jgi:hypothetical protein
MQASSKRRNSISQELQDFAAVAEMPAQRQVALSLYKYAADWREQCGTKYGILKDWASFILSAELEKRITFHGNSPEAKAGDAAKQNQQIQRIFLLSPANLKGAKAQRLCAPESVSQLSTRLRSGSMTVAELFSFASSLYFRGKLSYAQTFSAPPEGLEGSYLITSCRGLLSPETPIDLASFKELASGAAIDPDDDRYRVPLQRDAAALRARLGDVAKVILLGSVATPKYIKPLLEVFGRRLLFPSAFAGRGNMSRGGLLLQCVRERKELSYVPVAGLSSS